jgi:hypothetical protein
MSTMAPSRTIRPPRRFMISSYAAPPVSSATT